MPAEARYVWMYVVFMVLSRYLPYDTELTDFFTISNTKSLKFVVQTPLTHQHPTANTVAHCQAFVRALTRCQNHPEYLCGPSYSFRINTNSDLLSAIGCLGNAENL